MKLINFNKFTPFKNLRKKMDIEDDYKPDFIGSRAIIEALKWEEIKTRGLDISIGELKIVKDGTLEHEDYPGQKMIVYIRDYHGGFSNSSFPKFHVSWCSTLKSMSESGKYDRYVVSQRDDGIFLLNKMNFNKIEEKDIKAELSVCKNCLSKINFNNYKRQTNKDEEVKNFKIKEFLDQYNTDIVIEPIHNEYSQPINQYPENWNEISLKYRGLKNWVCEDCNTDFYNEKGRLHVHHIDGNKFNCKPSNLEAVCVECHEKKPYHGHMKSNLKFKRYR